MSPFLTLLTALGAEVLASAATVAAVGWGRARAQRRLLGYDPRQDQGYVFPGEDQAVTVAVDAEGFEWPEQAPPADTALLELTLGGASRWALGEPTVTFRSRHHHGTQFFERGAAGSRLLNLSAVAADAPLGKQRVRLASAGIGWRPQKAKLHLSRTPLPAQPRLLVVAPHPDDAEIAAGGLYPRCETFIATVTAGEQGGFYTQRAGRNARARLRTTAELRFWDSLHVPELAGVPRERTANLCYGDGTLEELCKAPRETRTGELPVAFRCLLRARNAWLAGNANWTPTWENLVAEFRELLRDVQPTAIATPHPQLDDHPDHVFSTLALLEALEALEGSGLPGDGQLLLYVNHSPRSSLYPFGPAEAVVAPPPHFREPVAFETIWSPTLTEAERERKATLLQAMHDLRTFPPAQPPGFVGVSRQYAAALRGLLMGLGPDAASYHRRGPRPNELFFTLPFAAAPTLRGDVLAAWRSGRMHWHAFH